MNIKNVMTLSDVLVWIVISVNFCLVFFSSKLNSKLKKENDMAKKMNDELRRKISEFDRLHEELKTVFKDTANVRFP
jgi:hypothetical protein